MEMTSITQIIMNLAVMCVCIGSAKPRAPNMDVSWKDLPASSVPQDIRTNNIKHVDDSNNTTYDDINSIQNTKRYTIIRDNQAYGGRPCMNNAIRMCDLRPMAAISQPSQTPCSLMDNFQSCIDQQTAQCIDPDVFLLKTSLAALVAGLHANGQCHVIPLLFEDAALVEGQAEECKPELTWACANQLVTDLRDLNEKTCDAVIQFRNCIRGRTRTCGYMGARFLVDGAQGLVWIFKKAGLCK